MAHLFTCESPMAAWTATPLPAPVTAAGDGARVLGSTTAAGETWILLGPPAVRVNGVPLATGLRVLRDRDEIFADGRRTYFSTETLAIVEPLPAGDRIVSCPRCRLGITAGSPAVRCPGCHTWHHESTDAPCWTYAEADACALCDHPTALGAGYRWTPEGL